MIKLLLKPGNIETAIGVMSAGNAAALLIRPKDKKPAFLYCDTVSLANELRALADQINPPIPVAQLVTKSGQIPIQNRIVTKTPLEVIEYFYQSDDLREHAEDVEEVLSKLIPGYNRQLIADMRNVDPKLLFEDGQPVKGIQSRIGEMLNIPNAGQGNRRRIQAILAELLNKYSTTTLKTPENATKAA